MKLDLIHDWDYPFYGRRYALKRIWQLLKYVIWPRLSRHEYVKEYQAFMDLELLLGLNAKYYPRACVTDKYFAFIAPFGGLHIHPKDAPTVHKIWIPGIGKEKKECWSKKNIEEKIAMDLPGRDEFTDKTEVLDVHIKPERQSLYDYVRLLADAKRKGVEFK